MDWLPIVFALWLTVAAWRAWAFDADDPSLAVVPLRVRLLMEVVFWPLPDLMSLLGFVYGLGVRLLGRLARRTWWR